MKFSRRNVSILAVVAVLVAAGGVGLLVRQACRGRRSSAAADEEIRQQQRALLQQRPGGRDTRETPEERAKQRELRAQQLEKMASLTEEEKAQFRAQIRERFSSRTARAAEAGRERALQARMEGGIDSLTRPEPLPAEPADANATPQDAAGVTPEPNQAGQH